MLTRLTPLQLVKIALLGLIIYGVSSVAALFNSHGPHKRLINLALILMFVGVTLYCAASWRVRGGLSRQAYILDQLKLVDAWVHDGIFRWSVNVTMIWGAAGVLYTSFSGFHNATIFTTLIAFGCSFLMIKAKILDAVKPKPTLPSRPGTVHGLHSDHWGSQGSS